MTNWIDCTNPIDIAIIDEDLISVLTKESLTLYSTQFSNALKSHKMSKAENIFADSKCVYITGKSPEIHTIDIETSTMRSKAVQCCDAYTQGELASKILKTLLEILWQYSRKEWLLGLIKGNGPQTIFALHGQHHNSKLTLTDVNHLSEYQLKSFHRYGVKDSKQALFDVLDGKVLATACNSGIPMQSFEFLVSNFKEHSRKLLENIRSAKARWQKNKDQKEEEKVKSRWEENAKKNVGVNAFDTKFTEHDFTMDGVIGAGQFGLVFKAKSKRTGEAVAIKVIVNRRDIKAL
ncbi:hypothetical protein GCK72_022612 [Caenorhabditis remanei]|uniref:Protein kinase domain-containing protein n=1 Tax=Caenorhabditis remanei TaxID=31234 RepID=A0A6A5FUK8_CAERE|nr:hypothetical protein GCK72_022612 [Caenorhabditis remanei]KAF1746159.1 hypothetical protein GCK72_022612 [Caenorhabditis remanei]